MHHVESPSPHEFVVVDRPQPGRWLLVAVRVRPGAAFTGGAVVGGENRNLQAFASAPPWVPTAAPVILHASARWNHQLTGLSVRAVTTAPSGARQAVAFSDDEPDRRGTGDYQGVYQPTENGRHRAVVTIAGSPAASIADPVGRLNHSETGTIDTDPGRAVLRPPDRGELRRRRPREARGTGAGEAVADRAAPAPAGQAGVSPAQTPVQALRQDHLLRVMAGRPGPARRGWSVGRPVDEVRSVAGSEPASGGRTSLGRMVGQGWALWLAGFLALAVGVALLVNPGAELRLVRWLVGLFLAGWGLLRLVHAARASRRERTWLVLSGLAALVAGIVVLAWPNVTVTALLYILVLGGLSLAAVDIVGALVNRRRDPGWWLSLLRGAGTLLLVLVLLVWPDETLNVVRVLAAVLLILWGASTLGEAFQSPVRDNAYRRELDQNVRRII